MTLVDLFGKSIASFDTSDQSTLTLSSGNAQQWVSKGTQVTASNTSGSYPTYSPTGLNGYPCLNFASGALLNIPDPSFFPTGGADVTIFALMQGASTASNQVLLKWGANGDSNHNLFGYRNSGNNGWYTNRLVDAQGKFDLVANPDLFFAEPRYSDATSAIQTSDNGTAANTTSSNAPNVGAANAYIGTSGIGYLSTFTGALATLNVVPRKITDAERQKAVAIVLWQWGLQANIPANNPDKNAQPTVTTGPTPAQSIILPRNRLYLRR